MEAMRREARKSGYQEGDAVRIVREYRAEKRKKRPAFYSRPTPNPSATRLM